MLNKYLYIYVRIILTAVIGILLCGLYCCTPQQKLKRLLKHHPDLIKSDTVFITKEIPFPVIKRDTVLQLDTNTYGLFEILDSLINANDSLQRAGIKAEIKNYVITRPILKDTFVVSLDRGGWVKIFQYGKGLKHILYEPAFVKTVTVPVSTNTVIYKDIPWRLAWYWIVIAFVCGIAIAFFISFKNKKAG